MIFFKTLNICFIFLFIAACDKQEQNQPVKKTPEIEISLQKLATQETKPSLNLSIDNISIEHRNDNTDLFSIDKSHIENNTDLFNLLNKQQEKSSIKLSGKLFTDDEKLENKEYLDSVEGMQINIEGDFD